ncbi:CD48 antigen-like isoform X2 [Parambassis ranga]|uniref:CD48 antigen-like isoform X2 n=1 Tax=Parambassis ranga TaxID=210632 RepID=A0A6P7I8C1_9TELE|nr:SLAM family member 7 isoform X2 [Parambassis ranga]
MQLRLRIILLLTVMRLSAEELKEKLKASVGGNITLPDPVMELGFLNYGTKTVAMVNNGKIDIYMDIYRNRIHWNKNSGLFTITRLQRNDSGIYAVDSKTGRIFLSAYKLTVYDPVPGPAVSTVSVSYDSCSLLCSVDQEATLCWYRDQEEVLNRSSHAVSLPLTVLRKDFNSSYKCVASNPAENKTAQVHMETSCSDTSKHQDQDMDQRLRIGLYVIGSIPVVTVLLSVFVMKRCVDQQTTTTSQTQGCLDPDADVTYTDIHGWEERRSQAGSFPDPPAEHSNLRTVYDKLEVHRMIPEEPAVTA